MKIEIPDKLTVIRTSEYINENLHEGETITWDTFVSTNSDVVVIDESPENVCFIIDFFPKKSQNWIYIGDASSAKTEKEILFAPHQHFKVIKIIDPKDTWYDEKIIYSKKVFLEHIPENTIYEQKGGSHTVSIHEWPVIKLDTHLQIGGTDNAIYKYKKYKTKYNNLKKHYRH